MINVPDARVLACGAEKSNSSFDVQRNLQLTGLFSRVDLWNCSAMVPKLLTLMQKYQSVFIWTSGGESFADAKQLGVFVSLFCNDFLHNSFMTENIR